ncbi:MAG TPA: hypothetical protein VJ806_05665 [Luteimonas sp.]|nr:hypothetical protein [Luteimonas sp.]
MKYPEALRKSVVCAVSGPLIGGFAASLLFDVFLVPHGTPHGLLATLVRSLLFYAGSFILAGPVTLLYGWPAYAFLLYKGWCNSASILLIPLLPAAMIYPHAPVIGQLVMLYGACSVLAGHWIQQRSV